MALMVSRGRSIGRTAIRSRRKRGEILSDLPSMGNELCAVLCGGHASKAELGGCDMEFGACREKTGREA